MYIWELKNYDCYLSEKADKTPQTGTDETQAIVHEMLSHIESEGEDAVRAYSEKLDNFTGDVIVSKDQISAAADKVSEQLKADIQFSYDRVTKFAQAQKDSIKEFETELSPGLWAGQKLIPIETAGCYVPGGRYAHVASAIMSVATAKVAGVQNVIACSAPNGNDGPHPAILYAMHLSGADTILSLGEFKLLPAWLSVCSLVIRLGYLLAQATDLWLKLSVCSMGGWELTCLLVLRKLRLLLIKQQMRRW